jgi:hypothetical protein
MPDVWSQDSASPKGFIETDEGVGRKNRRGELTKNGARKVHPYNLSLNYRRPQILVMMLLNIFPTPVPKRARSMITAMPTSRISSAYSTSPWPYDHRNAHEQDQQRVLNEPLALRERIKHECPQ